MRLEGGRRLHGASQSGFDPAPFVSVLTVVRNDVGGIERTIRSVLRQDYPRVEHIIVDGGSTDGTLEVIRAFDERIDYWISERDSGIYDAMNKAVALARGEWLSFLNSSDFFHDESTLSSLRSLADGAREGIRLIYGDTEFYDARRRWIVRMRTNPIKINMVRVNHQSCLMKKGPWLVFDTRLTLCADHELIFPMVKEGRSLYAPRCIATVKTLGQSSNKIRTMREGLAVSFRHGSLPDRLLAVAFYYYTGLKWLADLLLRLVLNQGALRGARHVKDLLEAHL